MRTALVILTLVAGCRTLAANVENPIGLMFVDRAYIPGAFEIQGETQHFLIVQYGYEEEYRKQNIAKRKLRYLVYPNHAVPYSEGLANRRIGLERVVEYPFRRFRLFALSGFAAGIWQGVEYWRARNDVRALEEAEWSDAVIRSVRDERDDHASYAVYAVIGGAAAWIISLRTQRYVRLEDGTTFAFRVGF